MNRKVNVLVFPCGAENAIEVFYALKDVVNIEVFGASGKSDHGEYLFKNLISDVPMISASDFLDAFRGIIEKFRIDVVVPTHDDVVLKLAECESRIPARLLIHGLYQARVARSKKTTYQIFSGMEFCPKVYSQPSEVVKYPVFVKPDVGQGGKGAVVIQNKDDWDKLILNLEDYVITEYLPGEEYTVDCFTDKHHVLRFVGPRLRARVSNGISTRSRIVDLSDELKSIAQTISDRLKLNGLWYFQVKADSNNQLRLLEVSLRVAGSMNLFRGAGVNFPLLAIYNALGYDVTILRNNFALEVDRALVSRYKHNIDYEHVFIDFDDTITHGDDVNHEVISFLFHARNSGRQITLLTRHAHDIYSTLNKLRIHHELFDKIIVLDSIEKKSNFIDKNSKSVFIDNAFAERKDVFENCNVPVFDVDAIGVLMDGHR